VADAGGLIGVRSFAVATVTFSGASAEGAQANPVVSRAIATGDVGPFLVAAMGFAGFLAAGGLVTLRSGVLPRWVGAVALIGAVGFSIAFLRQRVRVRLLPRHRRARHVVGRDEHHALSR